MRSILSGIVGESRARLGQSFHVSQTPPGYVDEWSGWDTAAGIRISPETALEINAVYACVRVLAETLAQLPLILYRRRPDGRGKDRATDHPLYAILHDLPNPEISSFEFREALMGHLATWGNAYAEIDWLEDGTVGGLWPLRPDRMESVERVNGELTYYYRLPKQGGMKALAGYRVMHIRGLSYDGIVGYSPIQVQRQTLALGKAAEEYGSRFFANDARPGGVLEHPGELSDRAYKRLQESWEKRHQPLEGKHRVAILEEGLQWKNVGLPPEDVQFLQTRKGATNDVARIYRMPPHMIQDLEHATFSNIEHESINFETFTMGPWFARWEHAIARDLLLPGERSELYAEFLVDALLRGDTASRYEAYATARQNGWMSANDIRERENMNPIENGDVYLVPLNMIPADMVGDLGTPQGMESDVRTQGSGEARSMPHETRAAQSAMVRHRLQMAHFSLYHDVAARVLRREANDVGNAARRMLQRRDLPSFSLWLEEFYREHHDFVREQFAPLAASYGELVTAEARDEVGEPAEMSESMSVWIENYLQAFAARHAGVSEGRIREAIRQALEDGEDVLTAIEALIEDWPDTRAAEVARWESVRFNNALGVAVYLGAGIQRLRWRAFGESCPYCNSLNGQVVGIRQYFLPAGEDFQPEGAESPLHVTHNIGHAPAHAGCDCMVTSA